MHPNPAFRQTSEDDNLSYARDRGFGVLSISAEGPPLMAHVPFLLSQDGASADLHLVRSNAIARAVKSSAPARIVISGPDSYVSPDWYGIEDQVPTWNYVAVHLTGELTPLPDTDLPDLLDRLSARFEADLSPKTPWHRRKMDPKAFARMLRMIQPFRLEIEAVDGTWKLNQNKSDDARLGAAKHIEAYGQGHEPRLLAGFMKSPPKESET